MANTSINLVDLDFENLKNSFKTYLKSQDMYKDYDFEGSNINILLDVLSYNTYMNAFYLNMIGNEMFLDSAQLRESVISRAKELNYTPRSFQSAQAKVNVSVETDGSVATVVMPKGTTFNTRIGANTFTFSTNQNMILAGATSTKSSNNIIIYEGQYINDTFVYNTSNTLQKFVLSNPTVDTTSITVTVIENNGADILTYTRATSLFDQQANSQIFFIQAAENEKYEVLFGDGVIGRKPKDNSVIVCDYRITKGELPNGAFKFKSDGSIGGFSNVNITTIVPAYGGSISESVESIKFNAPRYFMTQERAITTADYKNLLKMNFPEINDVSAYGGEEADPPQYGKVYIAVDIKNFEGVPDIKKQQYYDFIKRRCSLSIDPVFIDPDFMFLSINASVNYNINITALNTESIKHLVLSSIVNYNSSKLDTFGGKFRYSNFIKQLDASDKSIVSNDTDVRVMRKFIPNLFRVVNYDIDFQQPLQNDFADLADVHPTNYLAAVTSSPFTVDSRSVILEDDGKGNLRLIDIEQTSHKFIANVGVVDYLSGIVKIVGIKIESYEGNVIKVYARTKNKDIISAARTILTINPEDVNLTINSIRE